jgi:hypothetical protein
MFTHSISTESGLHFVNPTPIQAKWEEQKMNIEWFTYKVSVFRPYARWALD